MGTDVAVADVTHVDDAGADDMFNRTLAVVTHVDVAAADVLG